MTTTNRPTVDDCRLVNLPKIADPRGNLSFVEGGNHVPFEIRRAFWLYDVPGGESRAGHANKELEQLIVAVSGSFDVQLDDGRSKKTVTLRRSYRGLYVPGMIWRDIYNFSSGSVCLVLCSGLYDPDDYFRDHGEFVKA